MPDTRIQDATIHGPSNPRIPIPPWAPIILVVLSLVAGVLIGAATSAGNGSPTPPPTELPSDEPEPGDEPGLTPEPSARPDPTATPAPPTSAPAPGTKPPANPPANPPAPGTSLPFTPAPTNPPGTQPPAPPPTAPPATTPPATTPPTTAPTQPPAPTPIDVTPPLVHIQQLATSSIMAPCAGSSAPHSTTVRVYATDPESGVAAVTLIWGSALDMRTTMTFSTGFWETTLEAAMNTLPHGVVLLTAVARNGAGLEKVSSPAQLFVMKNC